MRVNCVVFAVATVVMGLIAPAIAAERPNVLLICVDDLKPLLGCYGDETCKSPNIDRLAARGMRFDRAYCNQAVCAPSRNACSPACGRQTLGIYDLGALFREAVPDAVTLPQYFKQHGYRTEALGKIFHVGHGNHEDPPRGACRIGRPRSSRTRCPRAGRRGALTREEALFDNVPGDGPTCCPVPPTSRPTCRRRLCRRADRRRGDSAAPGGMAAPGRAVLPRRRFPQAAPAVLAPKKYWDLYDRAAFRAPAVQRAAARVPRLCADEVGRTAAYTRTAGPGRLPEQTRRTLIHGYHAATELHGRAARPRARRTRRTRPRENTIIVLWGDHGWHLGDHGMWCKHTNYEQAARIPLIVVRPA